MATKKKTTKKTTKKPTDIVAVEVVRASGWWFRGEHYSPGDRIQGVTLAGARKAVKARPPFVKIVEE